MKKILLLLLFPCFAHAQCPSFINTTADSMNNQLAFYASIFGNAHFKNEAINQTSQLWHDKTTNTQINFYLRYDKITKIEIVGNRKTVDSLVQNYFMPMFKDCIKNKYKQVYNLNNGSQFLYTDYNPLNKQGAEMIIMQKGF